MGYGETDVWRVITRYFPPETFAPNVISDCTQNPINPNRVNLTNHQTTDIIHQMTYILDIRARRQVTIPGDLLKTWNLREGDGLILEIKNGQAKLSPKRQSAKALLEEISLAFSSSGISESELQKAVADGRRLTVKTMKWV